MSLSQQTVTDWNPASIEAILQETSDRIEKGVTHVDKKYREFLEKDRDFDVAEAKAYITARDEGKPAHACEHYATIATQGERLQRDLAEAEFKLAEKTMKALERKLDTYRSIGTSVREAYRQGIPGGA